MPDSDAVREARGGLLLTIGAHARRYVIPAIPPHNDMGGAIDGFEAAIRADERKRYEADVAALVAACEVYFGGVTDDNAASVLAALTALKEEGE